ncbi:helix-turn-helix transcriptional regulator [Anderseniella sp. Alg231-50]|uniref:helix-turn-helix transcriptional regulator n=1 Tax=Anderseniella sp. Alg231-50 TaxID=1922226 RepID=UPI00307B2ABC
MDSRFGGFVDELTTLPDAVSIWRHTADYAANAGYSGCSLVLGEMSDGHIRRPRIISSFSADFRQAYAQEGLGEIDPFLLFSCTSLSAKKIVTRDLSSFPGACPQHKMFLEHAAENGAVNNLGIPVRTPDNDVFGGWIFSNSETDEHFEKLHCDHSTQMHLAAVLAYERMVALGLGSMGKEQLLSDRERECLIWLCAGLRVSMIAQRLSLSESAVRLYITNARRKFGARTREQAIARAIFSGEINL